MTQFGWLLNLSFRSKWGGIFESGKPMVKYRVDYGRSCATWKAEEQHSKDFLIPCVCTKCASVERQNIVGEKFIRCFKC